MEEIFDTAITVAIKAGEEAAFDNRLNASDGSRGGSGLSGNSSEKKRRKKNKGCKFL